MKCKVKVVCSYWVNFKNGILIDSQVGEESFEYDWAFDKDDMKAMSYFEGKRYEMNTVWDEDGVIYIVYRRYSG